MVSLKKQLQLTELKEKTACFCLSKVAKEMEKIKLEKETLHNLVCCIKINF